MLKQLIRLVIGIMAPLGLIVGGSLLAGAGLEYDIQILVWGGGIVAACGVIWGCWLLLLDGTTSW